MRHQHRLLGVPLDEWGTPWASTDGLALLGLVRPRPFRDEHPVQQQAPPPGRRASRFTPFGRGAFHVSADRALRPKVRELVQRAVRIILEGDSAQPAAEKVEDGVNGESARLQRVETLSTGHKEWLALAGTSLVRETVASNLRGARERAGLSQDALAGLSGVDKRTISRIERATGDTFVSRLYALAFALSIPVADLLAGLPEP
jgi:DNA-binding XRE family transcriptional regulator